MLSGWRDAVCKFTSSVTLPFASITAVGEKAIILNRPSLLDEPEVSNKIE